MATRLLQVKQYNDLMLLHNSYSMCMTLGNGSMLDKPRQNGWVVFQSPTLGDIHDFAKWFPNIKQAQLELEMRV